MDTSCSNCHKTISIADDQLLSFDQDIEVVCSYCNKDILIKHRDVLSTLSATYKSLPYGKELQNEILQTLEEIPPMPQVAVEARQIVANPDSNFNDLVKVIEKDQAIAIQVMTLANSAFYCSSEKVTNLYQGTVKLGSKTLYELLTLACSEKLLSNNLPGYELESKDLWRHSLSTAAAARIIAKISCPKLEDVAFFAGLIHDVGKLILAPHLEKRKGLVLKYISNKNIVPFILAEKKILGFDHTEMAATACEKWNIADIVVDAVRHHHQPKNSDNLELASIVHLADAIAIMSGYGNGIDGLLYDFDESALDLLGISAYQMNEIMDGAFEYAKEISEVY